MNNVTSYTLGLNIQSGGTGTALGDITVNASRLQFNIGSGNKNIVLPDSTDTLTNKSMSGGSNTFTNIPLTSAVTGTLPVANGGTGLASYTSGDLVYASGVSALSKLGIGTTGQVLKSLGGVPAWAPAAQGGINYIGNPDAEVDTSGWSTFANSAANIPSSGTGGSPSVTWTRTTSNPLVGSASFLLTKAGSANLQGQGVSYAFTIDQGYQGQILAVTCNFEVASGTFTASNGTTAPLNDGTTSTNAGNSDLEFFIYDVTNSVLIPVSPQVLVSNSASVPSLFKGTFQTNINSTSYRLIIYCATATTNNYTVKFDNFVVGPQAIAFGAAITDWQTYSPTITGSITNPTRGTVSAEQGYWRRVGDSIEIQYRYRQTSAGSVGSGTYLFSLPSGLSIDPSKALISTTDSLASVLGVGNTGNVGTDGSVGVVWAYNSTNIALLNQNASAAFGSSTTDNFGNTNLTFTFHVMVPILGWSSTVEMSNDTSTRVVTAKYYASTNASVSSGVQINFDTKVYDTHNAVTTGAGAWKFTAPVSGYYRVTSNIVASAGTNVALNVYKNGAADSALFNLNSLNTFQGGSTDLQLSAGDYIDLRSVSSLTLSANTAPLWCYVVIERISGPATIAVTDTIGCSYNTSSQSLGTNTIDIALLTNKVYDYTGSYSPSTGIYTCPVSGLYQVNFVASTPGRTGVTYDVTTYIYKNSASVLDQNNFSNASVTHQYNNCISTTVQCLAGDTLSGRVRAGYAGEVLDGSSSRNSITITKIG